MKGRIQESESRIQKERKTKSVEVGCRLIILNSDFWILDSAFQTATRGN
jgi:hypothetical protein